MSASFDYEVIGGLTLTTSVATAVMRARVITYRPFS
jgi:hypothetical protein